MVSVFAFSSVKVLEEVALVLGGCNFAVVVAGAGEMFGFCVGFRAFEGGGFWDCGGWGVWGVAGGVGFNPPILSETV